MPITPIIDWNSTFFDEHRRGISDLEWADRQPTGKPKYKLGDIVEFKVGGFGIIDAVTEPHDGWPASYSTGDIKGRPPHSKRKCAWHYEGDFKRRVKKSPLHSFER